MIENFDVFIRDFTTVAEISENVIRSIYEKSRPTNRVDKASHRRSGATKRYTKDLKPETIKLLDKKLERILDDFKYNG